MQVLKGLCREEKEIEIWKVRKPCLKGKFDMSTWNRKLNWLFKENAQLTGGLSEAEADRDIRNWEQGMSDIAIYETNRDLESQRLELCQTNQWADEDQREKINFCGELEMRNRLFQESRARNCQEIEELRRICCEETDRARQLRIDELYMQQERNPYPTTLSQLLTQILDLQNKVNSLMLEFF